MKSFRGAVSDWCPESAGLRCSQHTGSGTSHPQIHANTSGNLQSEHPEGGNPTEWNQGLGSYAEGRRLVICAKKAFLNPTMDTRHASFAVSMCSCPKKLVQFPIGDGFLAELILPYKMLPLPTRKLLLHGVNVQLWSNLLLWIPTPLHSISK